MPFAKGGRLALTRTKKYLDSGRILLRDGVKIVTVHHVPGKEVSFGCDDFIKWFLSPLQFRNPNVQIVTYKNMCPTPFFKFYLENDEEIVVDCSFRSHLEIHDHLADIVGRHSDSTDLSTQKNDVSIRNPANFGTSYPRQCICEVYGQVPCSSHIGRPQPWPGLEPKLPMVDADNASLDS